MITEQFTGLNWNTSLRFFNQAKDQTNTTYLNYGFGPQYKIPSIYSTSFHSIFNRKLFLLESWIMVVSFLSLISIYVPNADVLWSKESKLKQEKCQFRNITRTSSKVIKHGHLNTIPHALTCLLLIVSTKLHTLIQERSFNEHHYCCVICTLDPIKSLSNHGQTRLVERVIMLLGNINW